MSNFNIFSLVVPSGTSGVINHRSNRLGSGSREIQLFSYFAFLRILNSKIEFYLTYCGADWLCAQSKFAIAKNDNFLRNCPKNWKFRLIDPSLWFWKNFEIRQFSRLFFNFFYFKRHGTSPTPWLRPWAIVVGNPSDRIKFCVSNLIKIVLKLIETLTKLDRQFGPMTKIFVS